MVDNQEQLGNILDLWQLGVGRGAEEEIFDMEDEEAVPTHLNTINSSGGFHVVSTDKLSVQYTSSNLHGHDVGVVQANCPAPTKRLVYYFEIFVKNAGQKGQIAIGFTNEHFKMRRQPGWEANSCGYHGDDGHLYRGQGKGEDFGPSFTSGDIVGGGINYASQQFFFTKNGELVGATNKEVKGDLFPTIAVHSQNEEVNVNFGQQPFVFDIELRSFFFLLIEDDAKKAEDPWCPIMCGLILFILGHLLRPGGVLAQLVLAISGKHRAYAAEERLKQQMLIEKKSLPLHVSHGIVRSYLLHYGYQDTLNSFDTASKSTIPPISVAQENGVSEQGDTYALSQRKVLRQLIRGGDIDSALVKLREWYPQLVQNDTSTICFLLHSQKFIELIRVGYLEDAVKYARAELSKFFEVTHLSCLLQDCLALLAYEEPLKSSVGYLLNVAQREVVADGVNVMVLSTDPSLKDSQNCLHSRLEKLLRQLTACCLERRLLNGNQGEAFNLHRVLHTTKRSKR